MDTSTTDGSQTQSTDNLDDALFQEIVAVTENVSELPKTAKKDEKQFEREVFVFLMCGYSVYINSAIEKRLELLQILLPSVPGLGCHG